MPLPVAFRDMNVVEVSAVQYHLSALFPEPSNGRSPVALDVKIRRAAKPML